MLSSGTGAWWGWGVLKSKATPSPGVRDPVNTASQLVARGEAGEDGTGEKKVLLGKGETVQAERGGGRVLFSIPRLKGLGGPGNGFPRNHGPRLGDREKE